SFVSSRRRHTRSQRDWSSDVCSSDLGKERSVRPVELFVFDILELDEVGLRNERWERRREVLDLLAPRLREVERVHVPAVLDGPGDRALARAGPATVRSPGPRTPDGKAWWPSGGTRATTRGGAPRRGSRRSCSRPPTRWWGDGGPARADGRA